MRLTQPETELFYATWRPLLRWVNEVRGVIPGLALRDDATNDPNDLIKIRDALWADDALLDAFVARNPAGLSDRALALAASWKHRRAGTFIVFRALKAHTVVIEDGPAEAVYAVLGLSRSAAEIPPWLPCLVDGVLLPFEGRIIFDGLLRCFSVHIGPGIRRRLNDVYRGARGRVVTSLGDASSLQVAAPSAAPVKAKPRPSTARRAKAPEPVDPSQFPGRCEGCGVVFSKRAIGRHLEGCAKVAALGGRGKAVTRYELVVESPHLPMYWMVLDVPASATLASVDRVLRDTWLECCGHLSEFRIGDVTFASNPDREYWTDRDERSMRAKVGDVAHVPRWKYEYDYGTTTELRLRVGRAHVGPGGRPRMLARNVAPPWSCVECGAAATSICAVCNAGTDTWLCAECATKHECGEEYLLPAVNSPRVGQCGYTGD